MAEFIPVDPFDLVIFGGTGDLSRRKLLPAMYHRDADEQLPSDSRILAVSRGAMTHDEFVGFAREALENALGADTIDTGVWQRFSSRLQYVQQDLLGDDGWDIFAERIRSNNGRMRVYYLATSPALYGRTADKLETCGLVEPSSRIVLEKPVGADLASAEQINREVGEVFREQQIYRIDHYLGKETVQNLMALRFANSLFEPLWGRAHIDHVQITVAEDLGVGSRGGFYDHTGALRDMIQNHLLQLLCLVAMEAPVSLDDDEIRDEKLKVLSALRPIDGEQVKRKTVRGQYSSGAVAGVAVPAYLDEIEADSSDTETFVAMKVEIDNWRWANTPFYLRTGKRMPAKCSEIMIQFLPVAHSIFSPSAGPLTSNQLIVRLQPNEGVTLSLMTKEPGPGGFQLRSLGLDLSFADAFQVRYPDSYERLLMEVIRGNPALFMRRDEVESAWRWTDQIIAGWKAEKVLPGAYVAGSWGPTDSAVLMDRDGRTWRDPTRN